MFTIHLPFATRRLVAVAAVAVAVTRRRSAAATGRGLRDPGPGRRERVPLGAERIELLAVRLTLLRVVHEEVEGVVFVGHLQATVCTLPRPDQRSLRSTGRERL